MAKFPRYVVLSTLLGGEPDVNRRIVYDTENNWSIIAVFNKDMQPWSSKDQEELRTYMSELYAEDTST